MKKLLFLLTILFIFTIILSTDNYTLAYYYTYPPYISSYSPYPAKAGEELTINGYWFGSSGSVLINNQIIIPNYWSSTQIKIVVPLNAESGTLKVANSDGNDTMSITIEKLSISSVTPTNIAPSDFVIVSGQNFGLYYTDSKLKIGNLQITNITSWSNNLITFYAPEDLTTVIESGRSTQLSIFASGYNNPTQYNIYITYRVDSASPYTVNKGGILEIFGSGFSDHSEDVYLGNILLNVINWTDTKIKTSIPTNISDGKYDLNMKLYGSDLIDTGIDIIVGQNIMGNDPYIDYQYYLSQIKADEAWSISQGSTDVVVAVIDSGVDTNHPDLTNNIWTNNDEIDGNNIDDDNNGYIDDVHGVNFLGNNKRDLTPNNNHGTMVAGIISARGNNNQWIAGISWYSKIMPLIVCNNSECNQDKMIEAIKYATDNSADIINLSLGGFRTYGYSTNFDNAVEYAYNKGVVIVVAAGNGDDDVILPSTKGRNLNVNKSSPVCNDNNQNMVLGVASVDANNIKTDWSDYGSNCIDVVAPGEDIISTTRTSFGLPEFNLFLARGDGTSFSAPMVSGLAALLKAKNPSMINKQIIDHIRNTADNIDSLNPDYIGQLGRGRINVYKAITTAISSSSSLGSSDSVVQREKNAFTSKSLSLVNRLKGYILLQVESVGEAWYVNPSDGKKYYMKDGATAYEMLRKFGLGITNSDLGKIPIEGSNQIGNTTLVNRLKGKILLQVESHGEAWYVNPKDGKRYYMRNGEEAYRIMRELSLGISNNDLRKIEVGEL